MQLVGVNVWSRRSPTSDDGHRKSIHQHTGNGDNNARDNNTAHAETQFVDSYERKSARNTYTRPRETLISIHRNTDLKPTGFFAIKSELPCTRDAILNQVPYLGSGSGGGEYGGGYCYKDPTNQDENGDGNRGDDDCFMAIVVDSNGRVDAKTSDRFSKLLDFGQRKQQCHSKR